jgi:predicted SAM-dependent methyltransferase
MPDRTPITPEQFDPDRFPKRVNLGCGSDVREGFVNVDLNAWYKPDVLADVRDVGFLPTQYYDELVAQDVLEHLPRTDTARTLFHWNRPLRMGGILRLRLPSVLGIADLLRDPKNHAPTMQEELIQCLFGTQAYTGDFHYTSFTRPLIDHYLAMTGFEIAQLDMLHGWLFEVEARKVRHHERSPIPDFTALARVEGDAAFLEACYREILGRAPDAGGYEFFFSGLQKGGMTRDVVINAMTSGVEYRDRLRAAG